MFFMPRLGHPEDNTLFGASNGAPNSVFDSPDKKYMSAAKAINEHNEAVMEQYKNENTRLIECIKSIKDGLSELHCDWSAKAGVSKMIDKQIKIYNLEDLICGGVNQEK